MERIGSRRFSDCRGKQRQIIKPRRESTCLCTPRLKFGQHRLGTRKYWRRQASKPPNRNPVAAIRWPVGNLVKQNKIALILGRADMVERQAIKTFGKPSEFVIVRCKETTAAVDLMHCLNHCPSNREAIIG